jgi:outer membrane protein assembly complex protein YaeT
MARLCHRQRSRKSEVRSQESEAGFFRLLFFIFFVICCLLLVGGSAFSSDINEPSRSASVEQKGGSILPIGSIEVVGARSIAENRIMSRVRSRVGEMFDAEVAAADTKRIAELAGVDYSYYNTAVVDGKIKLTFVVVEKNIVRSIVFVGNKQLASSELRKKLDLKVGNYLDPVLAESGRKAIIELYQKKGYPFVAVKLNTEQLNEGKLIYTVEEGPRVRIDAVSFTGNRAVKTEILKKATKTAQARFLVLPRYYVEEDLTADLTRLQNVYYERGFLDSSITVKKAFSKDKSKIRLNFVIEEGSVYSIEKITITGNEYFDANQLQAQLKIEQGQVYNERKVKASVEGLLKLYRENGFIDAKVEYSRGFVSKDRVNVNFAITQGERFRIGRIDISGNEQTQDRVIRRVLDEYSFQPGRWYNADIARGNGSGELEKQVQRMTVAEKATITPVGQVPGQRDAQVNIQEGQTGMVMLGAGVSSDNGIIGQLIFEQRNFDIKDWPENFSDFITGKAFKGAGQNLRIAIEPGTQLSRYSINFTDPYFHDKPITLNATAENFTWKRECYDEERLRGIIGFEKRYSDNWSRGISFRAEDVDIKNVDSDAPKEIKDVEGHNKIAGVKFSIARDLTDDKLYPTTGTHFDTAYEQVFGDFTFGIVSGTYRWYNTVCEDLAGRKTVLATRLYGATVVGTAPPFEKFYAGGSQSIRGFKYRGVSTRDVPDNDPVGSNWIFLAGSELAVPLASKELSALFFVDSGEIDSGNYRVAVGTGIQILLPQLFGPVPMRFEIAVPVMKSAGDKTQLFSFSVGRLF